MRCCLIPLCSGVSSASAWPSITTITTSCYCQLSISSKSLRAPQRPCLTPFWIPSSLTQHLVHSRQSINTDQMKYKQSTLGGTNHQSAGGEKTYRKGIFLSNKGNQRINVEYARVSGLNCSHRTNESTVKTLSTKGSREWQPHPSSGLSSFWALCQSACSLPGREQTATHFCQDSL